MYETLNYKIFHILIMFFNLQLTKTVFQVFHSRLQLPLLNPYYLIHDLNDLDIELNIVFYDFKYLIIDFKSFPLTII